MPYSIVINFVPISPISPHYLSGRHLHALFLTLVTSVDQELGNYLHQSKSEKAFVISPLQIGTRLGQISWSHQKSIPAGVACWFRISLLDEAIFGKLTHLWLNLNMNCSWHLGSADLHITSILGTPQSNQPWANSCSYEQLYEESSESERSFNFTFATPTAFRNLNYDTSLPHAESVFNSIKRRWDKYSGMPFDSLDFKFIFPSFFDIRTEIVADSRSKFIGCIGNINYRLFGEVEAIQIKQINTLANYALYCGVGRKTTMGMGMAMRIQKPPKPIICKSDLAPLPKEERRGLSNE